MPFKSPGSPLTASRIRRYKSLGTKKGRLENYTFLIEGKRAITQIVGRRPKSVVEIITNQDLPPSLQRYPVVKATPQQLRSIAQSQAPQGIIAIVQIPGETYRATLPEKPGKKILLLEDIQDPGNVGTLIRTAAAFNYSGVILTEKSADPFSPKCVQSTAGSVLSLWIRRTVDYLELAEQLKQMRYSLITADLNGKSNPSALAVSSGLLLAIGNEASGPSRPLVAMSDHRFKIPVFSNQAESLNVAACGAISMYLSSRT